MTTLQTDLALCANPDVDPTQFDYPDEQITRETLDKFRYASFLCTACPIRTECLQDGIDNGDWAFRGGQLLKEGKIRFINLTGKTERVYESSAGADFPEYKTDYLRRNAGRACKNNHPRTLTTIRVFPRGNSLVALCDPCIEMSKTFTDSYVNTFEKCDRGSHWLVPENFTDEGECVRCSEWMSTRRGPVPKMHCPKGHPYNEENTYWQSQGGSRYKSCRQCRREYDRGRPQKARPSRNKKVKA